MRVLAEEIFDSVCNIEWASDSLENIETVSSVLKEFEIRVEIQLIYLTIGI